jgi:hypothetical protein
LTSNSTGQDNTSVGWNSLQNNTTGLSNTALGSSSLVLNTSGANNTAIGRLSLLNNITGNNNTALGDATDSGNFNGSVILGVAATATASNQFVVGSASVNAGAVTPVADIPCTFLWAVKINGTDYQILMV